MGETIREFLREQYRTLPMLATVETCRGRAYIVTGSNIGIGLATAQNLVRLEASRVILAVRNVEAGEAARRQIDAATNTAGVAEVWHLDLASYDSVKAFAQRAAENLERLDGLIENATTALDRWTAAEGMETTITVNVFSTLLLAVLLLPLMMQTARRHENVPHLVVVTSNLGFARRAQLEEIEDDVWSGLSDETTSDMDSRYGLSKLIQIFAVRQFATLAAPARTGVVVNLISPGLCKSGLVRYAKLSTRLTIGAMTAVVGRTAEMGSRSVLHAAVAGEQSHGKLLSDCKIKDYYIPTWVTDAKGTAMQKQLWDNVAKRLETIEPGCVSRIL
ncbi:Uu.00g101880.m01.CDS01 [Anthostomella pinea]|uniref:Uu.00g101880.m01.CDS01 n=1 Tax=Anthostomella pinea TaxID=933095 RepID=A0AAI8V863_9PEZI|nr:Uu.00g101880.m01.CDS01 [Anthostomella pinea]